MNKDLKDRIFNIPQNVLDKINHTVVGLNGQNVHGVMRAKKLLSDKIITLRIVFIERKVYNDFFSTTANNMLKVFNYEGKIFEFIIKENIIFVMFEKTDNYLYKYIDNIKEFNINTDNPCKDTLEYMLVQCHKTEWIKIAIHLFNYINQNDSIEVEFMWIDFGIYHIFNNNDSLFYNEIYKLNNKDSKGYKKNKLRIGSCIHPSRTYHTDIYKTIAWYFAGGVLGGSSESLLQFAELMKSECINIIKEIKHLMWEVNVWYLIYLKNPELFDVYICDHNPSIISNY